MDRDGFWHLVDAARAEVDDSVDEAEKVAERVIDRLTRLPVAEILSFESQLTGLQRESYRVDLWAAAYLIHGGCSDDGFDYFRGWLVAQGRRVWESALADPDSLADVVTTPEAFVECEEMLGVAQAAYGQLTGDEEGFWPAWQATADEAGSPYPDDGPAGEEFDFDDEDAMRVRLPRLAALCLDEDDD